MSFGVDLKSNPIGEDILDLPQQIATARKRKVVVCIDEFQQIGEFADTDRIEETVHQVEIQDPVFKQWSQRVYSEL